MMDSYFLIVEGESEERFYKSTLNEYYNGKIYFEVVQMPSKRKFYSKEGKGGRVSYITCVDNIKRFLRQASHHKQIILIYDYYALDQTFKDHLSADKNDIKQKVKAIQDRLENDINNPRFKFTLQVHEFEAYLFSDIQKVIEHYNPSVKQTAMLGKIVQDNNDNPEAINDSPSTAPSQRLIDIFPSYESGKTTDGVLIAQKIGIDTIRSKCYHFNTFLEAIER